MSYFNGKQIHNITSRGDSAFIRYSANADGTDFTEEWSEGQNYIGFATGQKAPADKSGYTWVLFRGEKGEQGVKGDPYTLTEEDTEIIVNEVLSHFTDVSEGWRTITFKIGIYEFTAVEGMTWYEWCQTDYSNYEYGKFDCTSDGDLVVAEGIEVRYNDTAVIGSDVIIPNAEYSW